MKIRFLLAAAVASILALTSCDKDDPATPSPNNPGTSKKLKKLTTTEAGVTTVYNLSYDASNRLLSYKNADNSEYVTFTYDNQGNLTGINQQEKEFKNVYAYVYSNNVPVSGTFKSWELVAGQPDELIEDDQLTYTVTNNKVSRIKLEMLQSGTEMDLNLTYTGNNLTKVEAEGPVTYKAEFAFGNKRSAFPKVSNFVLDQAGFSLQFAANNELLSASFDFPGTSLDRTINTQYTYDSNGYVLTSNDGETQSVFQYE